jgi:hypothetical protein
MISLVTLPRLGPAAITERMRSDNLTGQNCSVLLTDVVHYSERTDQDRKVIRAAMYRIHRAAFDKAGISPIDYASEGRGDGILTVVFPGVATKHVVYPLLTFVAEELTRYNATAEGDTRFKLRVALDVGPVESDANGADGQVIIEAARLIDAPVLKDTLAQAPLESCLGVIVSEYVYNNVIKQHPGQLSPANYQPIIGQRVKGFEFSAWIKLAPDADVINAEPGS